jgi:uncharacterized protein
VTEAEIIFCGVVFCAFSVEATLGFGATVVTVALAAFVLPVRTILPGFVPLNLVLALYLATRYRQHIDKSLLLKEILPAMLMGVPVGLWVFATADETLLKGIFGVFVAVISARELFRLWARDANKGGLLPRPLRWLLLVAAGVMHGAFSTGGPLAVYVAGKQLGDKSSFRATLSTLWAVMCVVLITGYAIGGAFGPSSLRLGSLAALPLVAGMVAGEWMHRRIQPRAFQIAVFSVLLFAGFMLMRAGFAS